MNAPFARSEANACPLVAAGDSLESSPQFALRGLPLAPIGGGRWLWTSRRMEATPARGEGAAWLPLSRPRHMRRCGRAAFLWALLWYAVVGMLPLFFAYRWQRIGPANEACKWPALRQLVNRNPDRPLLLMLGSSRACWAFRASFLNGMPDSDGRPLNVYNFGIPSSGAISQLCYLRDMVAEGIRPRLLLLECLPPLLCEAQDGGLTEECIVGIDNLSARRFLQWLPYLKHRKSQTRLWLEERLAPWYIFRRAIHLELQCRAAGIAFPTYPVVDNWGWTILGLAPFSAEERKRRLEVSHDSYAPSLGHFRLGKNPTRAMCEILDLCRREKIPTALLVMPESSEFRSWYSDEAKTRIHQLLQDFSRIYDAPIVDANCWLADDDFEDGQHALLHGADVFTYRLAMELPRLLAHSKAEKSD